jgi:hypothetical protein
MATKRKITKLNNQYLILERYLGRNNNKPNKTVLIATNANPISGKTPPYSLRMVLKNFM